MCMELTHAYACTCMLHKHYHAYIYTHHTEVLKYAHTYMHASFVPRPLPPRRGLVHCLRMRMRKIFRYISVKSFVVFRRGSIIFPNIQSNRKVTNQFTKAGRSGQPQKYFPSYTVCSASALSTIGLYNRNTARYSLTMQQIGSHSSLRNEHARFIYVIMYGKCTLFYESPKNWGY